MDFAILEIKGEFKTSGQREQSLRKHYGHRQLNTDRLTGDENVGVEIRMQKWVVKQGRQWMHSKIFAEGVSEGKK